MTPTTPNNAKAFTAVELLAATVLSAVLMVAVLGVVGFLGRANQAADLSSGQDPLGQCLATLRWDLANARKIAYESNRLTLRGYGGLDQATLAPTHRPVDVTYAVAEIGYERWLVRREADLDDLTNQNVRIELVCRDVDQLQIHTPLRLGAAGLDKPPTEPADGDPEATAQQPKEQSWLPLTAAHGWIDLPDRIRLLLWTTASQDESDEPTDQYATVSETTPGADAPPTVDHILVIR